MKPLKDLFVEADKYLGQTKIAAHVSDEVSSLADTLAFATQLEAQFEVPTATNEDLEKVAKTLNKIAASAEIEVMLQTEQFQTAARTYGYTEEQINEALDKVAAAKIHKNLGVLTAMGVLAPSKKDLNSLEHLKKVVSVGDGKRVLPLTRALRGAQ